MKLFQFLNFFKKKNSGQSTIDQPPETNVDSGTPKRNAADIEEQRLMRQQSIQRNLINSLKTGDEKSRLYAIEELMEMNLSGVELSEKTIPVLLVALLDSHSAIREKAARLLEAWNSSWMSKEEVAVGIPRLIEYLVSGSKAKSTQAFRLLRQLNTLALPYLVQTLDQTENEEMRLKVVQIMGVIEGDLSAAVPSLLGVLKRKNSMVKEAALKTMVKTGRSDIELGKALVECLEDPSADVRVVALKGLLNFQQFDSDGIEAVVRCLLDPNREVRIAASKTLAGIGVASLEKIIALVEERDLLRKQELVSIKASKGSLFKGIDIDKFLLEPNTALRNVSWHFKDMLDALDRIEHGISLAVKVLGRLKDSSTNSLNALESALFDFNPSIRREAVSALGTIGPPAKNAMTSLYALHQKADFTDYKSLVHSLNAIDPEWNESDEGQQFLQFLTNCLQDNREQLQILLALKALPKTAFQQLSSSAMKMPTAFNKEVIRLIAILGENTMEAELYINKMIQKEQEYIQQKENEPKRIGFKRR